MTKVNMHWNLTLIALVALAFMASNRTSRAEEADSKNDPSVLPAAAKRTIDFVKDIQPIFVGACYDCHGPDAQEAGLRLDVRKRAMAGGDNGKIIVPGDSAKSRLIHLAAGVDEDLGQMPPEDAGDKLTDEQIALLRAWIDRGAEWPDEAAGDATVKSDHWSFQPIRRSEPPSPQQQNWIRNPIDSFILTSLEAEGVKPSPEADRSTLLRRVYLDLVGLPPTPEEVAAFLADDRPDAYDRVVDRLLESPHFGERWGRHWLDVARYADSDGYEKDLGRPFAWRYRDWVIQAVNADMPFTLFTIQQLAGDLLGPSDPEYSPAALVATGFHRNTLINKEGGVDPEEDRVKRTIDRTNTLGVAWLGLSVGCANCHTHKYDPITQREYFELYAFFNNLDEVDAKISAEGMVMLEQPDLTPREVLPDDRRDDSAAPNKEPSELVPNDNSEPKSKPAKQKKPTPEERAKTLAQTVAELKKRRDTYIHLRGDFLSKGPIVEPQTLEVLPPLQPRSERADRLDLARWIVADENPLTARVTVNRIWQTLFGRGLVATADDFGTQGDPPTHPELLDWLADEFRQSGWRMKHMVRLIVTSAAYRQSSAARPELVDRDPYNAWVSRQNRLRVEAEIVRDVALSVSGLLNPTVGGPSIRPPQPPGVSDLTYAGSAKWKESQGADRYRRGLYVWFQRTSPFPSLITFDAPEASLACTRRERSNTPLQALTLLNDVVYVECAQAFGNRIHNSAPSRQTSDAALQEQLNAAVRLGLSREPTERETTILRDLYAQALAVCRNEPDAAALIVGMQPAEKRESTKDDQNVDQIARNAAWVAVARAILNLDEFITRE